MIGSIAGGRADPARNGPNPRYFPSMAWIAPVICITTCFGATSDPAPPPPTPAMTPDQIRAIVASVLADAEMRSSLSDGPTAGFDGRFFIADPESGFRLSFTGEFQGRYQANLGANGEPGATTDSEFDSGFYIRNLRLDFRGSIWGDLASFRVMPAYNRSTGSMSVLDAYVDVKVSEVTIRFGQFALPFTREHRVNPTRQLAAERSLNDAVFRPDRSQGIMAMRTWDRVRAWAAFSDGSRAANTDMGSPEQADAALTGRIEARLLEGAWEQYINAFSVRTDAPGLLLGAAAHWQIDGVTSAPSTYGDNPSMAMVTGDLTWKAPGWTAMAAGVARHIAGDDDQSATDYGMVAQVGALVSDHFEVFGRYTHLWPGADRTGGTEDMGTIEIGGSWYLIPGSRVCRVTLQGIWLPDPQSASSSIVTAPNVALAIQPDSSGGQVGLMLQVQMVF